MTIDFKEIEQKMNNCIDYFTKQSKSLKPNSVNSDIFEELTIDAYGVRTPIKQLATFSNIDSRTLIIKPFDSKMTKEIMIKIQEENLRFGINASAADIKLTAPEVTEERRLEVVKMLKSLSEDTKVKIRMVRRDILDRLKSLKDISEDEKKRMEDTLQKITDKFIVNIENLTKQRELEIIKI